jgi:response regulator of citrate/malate metabolism
LQLNNEELIIKTAIDTSKLKVLIVDDDEAICEVLETFLSIKGIHVRVVYNGKEAIKEISKNIYNIIFLDNYLPDIEGVNILKRGVLKKENCYVVFMTGGFHRGMIKETVKFGVNEILLKPFMIKEINNIIERAANFFQGVTNFKDAVQKIEVSEINIVTDNNISIIKSLSKIIIRNVCDANFFDDEMQLILAIYEVLANAIYHGNLELDSKLKEEEFEKFFNEADKRMKMSPYKDRKIFITSYFNKQFFKVVVRDEGKGFNWKMFMSDFNRGEELPYGRGFLIIFSVFDEVTWNEQGNEITLVKYKWS